MSGSFASSTGLPYLLLMTAVAALWVSPAAWRPLHRYLPWTLPLAAAIAAALATGAIHPVALASIAGLALACLDYTDRPGRSLIRAIDALVIVCLSLGLLAHAAPGFANVRQISSITLSADALSYSQYLNFDKPLIGLFILGLTHRLLAGAGEWRAMCAAMLPRATGLLAGVIVLSLALGFVRWEGHLVSDRLGLFAIWAPVNLFFTCVPEEALFRGFLQRILQGEAAASAPPADAASPRAWLGLAGAALLFGLAYLAGGLTYVLLAAVAGFGYGWVYWRTNSIEASILTHFLVNSTHFLLFTYPALKG